MYDIIIGREEQDRQKFGTRGAILLGKQYVRMGQTESLANKIYLDIARAHVVFVAGKRGGGKCLTGDTIITLSDGTQKKIKDLISDATVMSLNSELQIEPKVKEGFYQRTVPKLLQITLRSGKKIELTPEHPLLTVKGWQEAQNLAVSSRIATPRVLPSFGEQDFTEDQVKILGYLYSEGHVGNNFILFTNQDEKIVADFSQAISHFDSNLEIKIHGKNSYRVVENKLLKVKSLGARDNKGCFIEQAKFKSRKSSLRVWLDTLGVYGYKAYEKFFCKEIFNLSEQKTSIFLNRLFSCDGSIGEKMPGYWVITYSSSSQEMITQVQHLLSKFGIMSRFRQKKTPRRDSYELNISGEFVHTFLIKIGFYGEKEKRSQKALSESIKLHRNPNVDTIPKEIWELYAPENWAELGRKLNYAHPKALRESQRYSPSRQKLLQIAKADQSDLLEKFATSDIFWDEITKIEILEGSFEVYDITVPGNHNFVANDIIVHNSYTLGVIAEGLADLEPEIQENISIIILDTMGIYWTMKYPNSQDEDLLQEWGLKPKGLDVKIYTPKGYYAEYKEKGIPTDFPFSVRPSELAPIDWCMAFDIAENSEQGVLIQRIIYTLQDNEEEYDLDKLISLVESDDSSTTLAKQGVQNLFSNAKNWGLFDSEGTQIKDLAKGGQVTILDVSCYATEQGSWAIKQMAVGLIAQKLFIERMLARKDEEYAQVHKTENFFGESDEKTKQKFPLVWLVIDEAHEFLPKDEKVASSDPLITILREGRQPGISLILATQQPGKIHTDVMTQSDTVLSHRITAKVDTDALSMLMQSYMRSGLDEQLDHLPRLKGAGIIFDDTNEKLFPMRVRPRFTWHGGSSPDALPKKKTYFE